MEKQKRHKPIKMGGWPSQQRCTVCGATRQMWGFNPMTGWDLNGETVKWCPGSKQEK